MKLRHWHVF